MGVKKTITGEQLKIILDLHLKWLYGEAGGRRANLSNTDLSGVDLCGVDMRGATLNGTDLHGANLSVADLSGAILHNANLSYADLSYTGLRGVNLNGGDLSSANLRNAALCGADLNYAGLRGTDLNYADLRGATLNDTDLHGANLCNADLRGADLRDAIGLLSPTEFLATHFEKTGEGYIAYKTLGVRYAPPKELSIEPGAVIEEVVEYSRTQDYGSGINVSTYDWVKRNCEGTIWKVLIEWQWLPGVCVPYNSGGQIRCEKVRILEVA